MSGRTAIAACLRPPGGYRGGMTSWLIRVFAVLPLILGSTASAQVETAKTAAILGMTLLDTSTEGDYFGPRADEAARIEMLEDQLAEAFADRGYETLDTAPVAARVEDVTNIARANGLDVQLARELGADLAVTGEVQKVSNLILTMNVLVRDAASGELLRAGNADIRSNTDESWTRGLAYVLRNRIFADGPIELD